MENRSEETACDGKQETLAGRRVSAKNFVIHDIDQKALPRLIYFAQRGEAKSPKINLLLHHTPEHEKAYN